jgi:hypothetical protein
LQSAVLSIVLLSVLFPEMLPKIHQLGGIIAAMFVNYFLYSYWTSMHALCRESEISGKDKALGGECAPRGSAKPLSIEPGIFHTHMAQSKLEFVPRRLRNG